MKKLTLVSALCLAMFAIASCGGGGNGKEDIDPEEKPEVDPEINEPTVTLNPQVAGRCALGYVTYYGTSIPECYFMTHMNYALQNFTSGTTSTKALRYREAWTAS